MQFTSIIRDTFRFLYCAFFHSAPILHINTSSIWSHAILMKINKLIFVWRTLIKISALFTNIFGNRQFSKFHQILLFAIQFLLCTLLSNHFANYCQSLLWEHWMLEQFESDKKTVHNFCARKHKFAEIKCVW